MQKRGAALRAVQDDLSALHPAPEQALQTRPKRKKRRSAKETQPPLPDPSTELRTGFAPVPRRYRHDGWTPERQKAFIEALADTGCVTRAAGMVNMSQNNCYTLRRSAGAEEFGRAWDAALDFGLKRLKDIAFERAIEGQLVPVFASGKLMGFRRKRNDALLMFCLRHYGQDASGKRTTINYFSSRASAGAGASAGRPSTVLGTNEACAGAEASTTTVRTVIRGGVSTSLDTNGNGGAEEAAALLGRFEGVELDAEAQAAIAAALEACAMRAREAEAAFDAGGEAAADAAEADAGESFFAVSEHGDPYRGELLPPVEIGEYVPFAAGEAHWHKAGAEMPPELARIEEENERRGRGQAARDVNR